jgi:hypothetical protein
MIRRLMIAGVCLLICARLSSPPGTAESGVTLEVVPNALVLKILAGSQLDFVADLFWVRLINMSSRASNAREASALLPMGNLIADIAPRFKYPYFLVGVIAPWRRGKSHNYDNATEAVALMTRGVAITRWGRLYLQKAFTELEMLHDPNAAGTTLIAMSREPDAPAYVAPLATRLLAQGGNFGDARLLAASMARSEDPQVRADGEARLKQIDLEETLVRVDSAVEQFTASEGHSPATIDDLVAKGLLPAVPPDPLGGKIELTPDGARSSANHERFRQFVPLGTD